MVRRTNFFLLSLFLGTALFVNAGFGLTAEDAGILPDSPLYVFDRFFEGVHLFFITGDIDRANFHLRLADERVAECQTLVYLNQSGYCEGLMESYEGEVSSAITILNRTQNISEEMQDIVQTATARHTNVLRGVLETAPETARPALENAINTSLQGQETVSLLRRVISEEVERAIEQREVSGRFRQIVENATGKNLTAAETTDITAGMKEEVRGIMRDVEGIVVREAEEYIEERNVTDLREILGAIRERTEEAIENVTVP